MKKFLSILLALAVGFTFTFGSAMSAFAYTDSEFNANVNAAQAEVVKALDTSYNTVVNNLKDTSDDLGEGVTYTIEAAQWKDAAKSARDAIALTITAKANEIKATDALKDYEVTDLVDAFYATSLEGTATTPVDVSASNIKTVMTNSYKNVASYAQFGIEKTAFLNAIKTVDLSVYSDTEPKNSTTYRAQANEILTTLNNSINAITVDENDTADAIATAYKSMAQLVSDNNGGIVEIQKTNADGQPLYTDAITGLETTTASGNKPIMTGVWQLKKSIHKIADDATDALTLEAEKKAALATMNSKIADYAVRIAAALPSQQAGMKKISDSYETVMTYLINSADTKSSVTGTLTAPSHKVPAPADIEGTETYLESNINTYADLEVYAKKYAAEKDAYGNLVRDQKKIDKVLLGAKYAIYSATAIVGADTIATYENNIKEKCYVDVTVTDYAYNSAKALIEEARKAVADSEDYYDLEMAKVNAEFDKLIASIDNAATPSLKQAAINAVNAKLLVDPTAKPATMKEVEAIETAVLTGIKKAENVKTDIASYIPTTKLVAYANYINNGLYGKTGYRDFVNIEMFDADTTTGTVKYDTYATAFWTDFYGAKGARTKAEVDALYTAAIAAIDAVPTAKEIATKKTEVEALINALPATVTVEAKEQVAAAFDAAVAYNKTINETMATTDLVNVATLNKAIKSVADAEYKALAIAEAALPTSAAKVTIADKAAVKAQAAAVKAYNDAIADDENMYYNVAREFTSNAETYLGTIKALEQKNVKDLIAAIPVNVTEADKATVEAAKKAYDDYIAEYTDETVYGVDPAKDFTAAETKELEDALTALDLIEKANKFDDQDAKAYTQDLAIAVRTVKSGKKVKVTVNADVQTLIDNGFTVEYKFYKSTKKSSGYKNTVNKTTNTYTNTNPVKGKNYYKVKLVVKNADGTVVATTPLTQCKYGVRTMK